MSTSNTSTRKPATSTRTAPRYVKATQYIGMTVNFVNAFTNPKQTPKGESTRTLIGSHIVNPSFGKNGMLLTHKAHKAYTKLTESKDAKVAKAAKFIITQAERAHAHVTKRNAAKNK